MDLTLAQIGFLILFITASARTILLTISLFKFIRVFDRKIIEGSRLIKALEIPGLKRFIRHEVILGFLPYAALFVCVQRFNLAEIFVANVNVFIKIIAFFILLFWLTLDWWRSFSIYEKLSKLHKETDKARTISGSALDALKFAVHIKGSVKKTVVSLGLRAFVGALRGRLKRKQEETGKTPTGVVAVSFVDRLISFPERVTGKLTDWAKDDLDNRLMKKFSKYAERSVFRLSIIFVWGLVPSIVLTGLSFL